MKLGQSSVRKTLVFLTSLVEKGQKDHDSRIADLEKNKGEAGNTYNYQTTTEGDSIDRIKEIKDELNHVDKRIENLEKDLEELLKDDTDDGLAPEKEQIKEDLKDLAKELKSRVCQLEDKTKVVVVNVQGEDESKDDLEKQIEELRQKLKDIEKQLKALKKRKQSLAEVKNEDGSIDYEALINQVRDQLEQDMSDLTERVESLETDNEKTQEKTSEHDKQIDNHEQRIKDLEQKVNDLVEKDTFNTEINYIKNLLKELSEGKDVSVDASPAPAAAGMSAADKSHIEQLIKDLEKRVDANEKSSKEGISKNAEDIKKL